MLGPNEDGAEAYKLHLESIPCPTCGAKESEFETLRSRLSLAEKEREATNKELSILAEFRRISYCVLDGHWLHYRDNPDCKCSLCELKKLYYFGQGEHLTCAYNAKEAEAVVKYRRGK